MQQAKKNAWTSSTETMKFNGKIMEWIVTMKEIFFIDTIPKTAVTSVANIISKQEGPWALDRSPESLSGKDVYHKI